MFFLAGESKLIDVSFQSVIHIHAAYDLNANSSYPFRVQNVNTSTSYDTIQAAIDDNYTISGHTIFATEGVYYENVVVTKSVNIIGENKCATTIDGNHAGPVIHLKSNNTLIQGFTLQNGYYGVLMSPWTHGSVIRENLILNNGHGISGHYDVVDVTISWNTIVYNNNSGIDMLFSNSIISSNLISNNGKGEYKEYSSGIQISSGINSHVIYCVNNTLSGNTIKNHRVGIWAVRYSTENLLFHNNFANNTAQILASANTWNNSVTENYWDDYNGTDTDNDGLGDVPYITGEVIQDDDPLMGTFSSFITSQGYHVEIVSNSTIDSFQHSIENGTIRMYVSNATMNQTAGFCRMTIPYAVLSPSYKIEINDNPVSYIILFESQISNIIYFNYSHSPLKIVIIPERRSTLIILVLMTSILMAISRRRRVLN
jgi:parallel beta-helix repeat protein